MCHLFKATADIKAVIAAIEKLRSNAIIPFTWALAVKSAEHIDVDNRKSHAESSRQRQKHRANIDADSVANHSRINFYIPLLDDHVFGPT